MQGAARKDVRVLVPSAELRLAPPEDDAAVTEADRNKILVEHYREQLEQTQAALTRARQAQATFGQAITALLVAFERGEEIPRDPLTGAIMLPLAWLEAAKGGSFTVAQTSTNDLVLRYRPRLETPNVEGH